MIRLEVCIDSPEGLARAIAGGADRIELCAALPLGGLTPSAGLMRLAAEAPVPVYAMVRPREGDFIFTSAEAEVMRADIRAARQAGLAGVVLGAATPEGRLDVPLLSSLMAEAAGMGTTLHRVVDTLADPAAALADTIALGFERILTSGGAGSALAGSTTIRRLHELAAGRIAIMAGGGLRAANAIDVLQRTGVDELHGSCAAALAAPVRSGPAFQSEAPMLVDPAEVAAIKSLIATYGNGP
jgi:copper homeostasis protein